ncbi:hypothetical protein D3C78_879150 [compost metagenome]
MESKRDTEREAEENGFLLDDEDRQVRHGGDEEQDGEGRQGEAAHQKGEHRRQQDADEQVAQEIKRHIYRQLFECGSMADDFTRAGIPQIGEIPDADIEELDQQYGRKQRAIPQKERQQHGFRLGADRRRIIEPAHAAAKQQIAGNGAETGHADAKQRIAQKNPQPVEEAVKAKKRAGLGIVRHMDEHDS